MFGRCERCGEEITERQYNNGNYNGHNGHEETHMRCRSGWQARAMARSLEAGAKRYAENKEDFDKQERSWKEKDNV